MADPTPIEPTAFDYVLAVIEDWFEQKHGPMPARVEVFKPPNLVDVQPVLQVFQQDEWRTLPVLRGITVAFPEGGGNSITYGLKKGDVVELMPQGWDLSLWISQAVTVQAPGATRRRRLTLGDIIAHPTFPRPVTLPMLGTAFAADGSMVLVGSPALLLGGSDAIKALALDGDVVAYASTLATWMGQVETAINILAPGSITPLSPTFTAGGNGTVTASALGAKGK